MEYAWRCIFPFDSECKGNIQRETMQVRVAQRYPLSYPRYLRPARSPNCDTERSPLGAKVKDLRMAMPVVGDRVREVAGREIRGSRGNLRLSLRVAGIEGLRIAAWPGNYFAKATVDVWIVSEWLGTVHESGRAESRDKGSETQGWRRRRECGYPMRPACLRPKR